MPVWHKYRDSDFKLREIEEWLGKWALVDSVNFTERVNQYEQNVQKEHLHMHKDYMVVDESNFTENVLSTDSGVLVYFTDGLEWFEDITMDNKNKVNRKIKNL